MSSDNTELARLIAKAKDHTMTPMEVRGQRASFAYGNVHLHNPAVTREMVNAAADELDRLDQLDRLDEIKS